jgi:Beta-lactamase class C and other penicillin binding proteins
MTTRDPNQPSVRLRAALAAYLDASEAGIGFSGVVLVSTSDGRVAEARGLANIETAEPNRLDTRFNTASLTKFFTAVAVCRLLESDASAFDWPIAAWLGKTVSAELVAITPRQLLIHTSGLPEQVPDEPDGVIGQDWLAPFADVHLDFAPGSAWQYSNAGYSLLGALIERATGLQYFEAMRAIVFDPVGMVASGFEDTAEAVPGRAVGYAATDSAVPGVIGDSRRAGLGHGAPYGYAFSTVADIERLLRSVDDYRVVEVQSARQILFGDTPTSQPGRFAGFGLFIEDRGSTRITTSAGAGPGISAWLDFVPERDYLSLILANRPKPAAHAVGAWLRGLALPSRSGA